MRNLSRKILMGLLVNLVGVFIMVMPIVDAAQPAAVAEVANELHGLPKTEVEKELQPDRIKQSTTSFNGTLQSIPGLHLP
ncbi:MAG: hypothetical protein H6Q74_2458 [Firmicutes bacterium]|nr:hypothetical protein [Bacillota bacterium]